MQDYDNIMHPDCLGAIRKALVAYYNRLEQFEALKVSIVVVGSHKNIYLVRESKPRDAA